MHRLSMVQALGIWSDLEAAYHGKHGFGSDTAEIYMHRLMPRDPSAEEADRRGEAARGTMFAQALYKRNQEANEALGSLLLHFSETHNVQIEVEGEDVRSWIKAQRFLDHRAHVKVIRR